MSVSGLVADVCSSGILAVAEAADLHVKGRAFGPCLVCAATERGSKDKRPPCAIYTRDGRPFWRCASCGAGFDAIALASYAATGEPLSRENYAAVRSWCAWRGLCAPDPRDPVGPPSHRLPAPRPVPDGIEAQRPPADELRALIELCQPVTTSRSVARWLVSRGLDPLEVGARRLAKAIPFKTAGLPHWARSSAGPWTYTGHRVLLPLYGPTGRVESVRARAVTKTARPAKALAPAGYSVAGLVLADQVSRRMLRGEPNAVEHVKRFGLVVAEGEPDFFRFATATAERGPGVVGVIQGSWSERIAARIPSEAVVLVKTHEDATGAKYAHTVEASLASRCSVSVELEPNA